jgi:hypothetical protein
MAGKRKNPLWRQIFLRALARTGNVGVSAAEAGVDRETAYNHRRKDPAFAAKWAGALEKAKGRPPSRKASADKGEELVLRRTKHGDQMIRVAAGRWCADAEAAFFEALMETACVRSAALACGFSTNALYQRREAYPEFAQKWDRVLGQAKARIPDMLAAATIASLDPDQSTRSGRGRLPKVNVDQAIRISAIEQKRAAAPGPAAGRRGLLRKPVQSEDELKADLARKITSLRRRREREKMAKGWIRTDEGVMIPPGWIYVGTDAADGGKGDDRG